MNQEFVRGQDLQANVLRIRTGILTKDKLKKKCVRSVHRVKGRGGSCHPACTLMTSLSRRQQLKANPPRKVHFVRTSITEPWKGAFSHKL